MSLKLRYRKLSKLVKLSNNVIHEFGFRFFINAALYQFKKDKMTIFAPETIQHGPAYSDTTAYNAWSLEHHLTAEVELKMRNELSSYLVKPKISIVISINDKNVQHLKRTLGSLIEQIYENFEIRLVYSKSIRDQVYEIVKGLSDSRIVIGSGLEQTETLNKVSLYADGEFLVFVNCGAELMKDALFRVVKLLNENKDVDIVYFDEEEIHPSGQRRPLFKPDWSPDLFLSCDYISNFYVVRKKLFVEHTGLRNQFGYAKHYDLLLRLAEKTAKIFHIATIGVSIHVEDNEVPPASAFERDALNALSDTLIRRGIKGEATNGMVHGTFKIKYSLDKKPKVTIIIPTKDQVEVLKRCIKNIEKKTSYENYEIIIVDNNSVKEETISYLRSLPYTVLKYEQPFNFSKINNMAVSHASGDYLLFLNDDTAPLEPNWLTEMISIGIQDNIGIVGAKLVLSNNTIQHAGLVFLKTGAGFHPLQGVYANSPDYYLFLNIIRNFSAVTGACLLINKKVFEQVGGFDENFDLYYGDADLCLNVLNHGYRIVYTPYAKLLHEGSRTIKENSSSFFAIENHHDFIKKWPYLKNGDPFYNPNLGWNYEIDTKHKEMRPSELVKSEINTPQNVLIKKYTEFINSICDEFQLRSPNKDDLGLYISMLIYKQVAKEGLRNMFRDNVELINSIFKELLLRSPSKEEVDRYFSMLVHGQVTKEGLRNMFRDNVELINSIFKELLLRSPDRAGLERYFFMLMDKKVTGDELRRIILETEEAKSIQNFSHYSDHYWNELNEVERYLSKLSTGDEEINWIQDMFTRFKQNLPFKEVLIVGCGNGWLERALYDLGVGLHFDAFDISEEYLEEAKKQRGNRPIDYFIANINDMENIDNSKYDVIFNYAILHHAEKIDAALRKLSQALKPNGLMFNWEYVGPSQNQYSDEHVKIMNEAMSKLPEKFRTKYPLRPPIENFRVEPTEAIHSDLIQPLFKKYFEIVYERDLNGGIAYQILWNNINNFKEKEDKEATKYLKFLLQEDEILSKDRKVPILFWYSVGMPKK